MKKLRAMPSAKINSNAYCTRTIRPCATSEEEKNGTHTQSSAGTEHKLATRKLYEDRERQRERENEQDKSERNKIDFIWPGAVVVVAVLLLLLRLFI